MQQIERLLEVMRALRDPEHGCPWDRAQTFESLCRYTIEEAYEVVDAVVHGGTQDHQDELGDLLFQIVFQSRIAEERGLFDFEAVAQSIADKLERRHPHVFRNAELAADGLAAQWERHKEEDRKTLKGAVSILDGVARAQPALSRAISLQKRAARCGFDWADRQGVLDKLDEEFAELRAALHEGKDQAVREEFGDLLFSVVNLARHLGLDAEGALRDANDKFERRFRGMETALTSRGSGVRQASVAELDAEWEAVKRAERQF
jgi:MazG family protein